MSAGTPLPQSTILGDTQKPAVRGSGGVAIERRAVAVAVRGNGVESKTRRDSRCSADLPKITRAQRQVLELAAAGYVQREIAAKLDIGPAAVCGAYKRIQIRLGARNSIEMVARAIVLGILDPKEVLAAQARRRRVARLKGGGRSEARRRKVA